MPAGEYITWLRVFEDDRFITPTGERAILELSDIENIDPSKLPPVKREIQTLDIRDTILAPNVRSIQMDYVLELARNILEHGQLQPCIGDLVYVNGVLKVRVFAGQHRYHAIQELNKQIEEAARLASVGNYEAIKEQGLIDQYKLAREGKRVHIAISIAQGTLTPAEILQQQMSENVHVPTIPAEEAKVMYEHWQNSEAIYGEGKTSVSKFARKLGRNPETVRRAIKYVENVSPHIKELVDKGVISYTIAVLLGDFPMNKEDIFQDQQFLIVTHILNNKKLMKTEEAIRYIKRKKTEREYVAPLFSEEIWESLNKNVQEIIKSSAEEKAIDAAKWFVRMIQIVKALKDPDRSRFSDIIRKELKEVGMSLSDFFIKLEELNPKEAKRLGIEANITQLMAAFTDEEVESI